MCKYDCMIDTACRILQQRRSRESLRRLMSRKDRRSSVSHYLFIYVYIHVHICIVSVPGL